jgi:uncharacterized protein with NRDE domain
MCIMAVMYRSVLDYPIVIAANRDEYYSRSAVGPRVLQENPMIWGGRDQQAKGSWLGVNAHGLVVGLTNRRLHDEQLHDEDRRSRGLLCLDALRQRCPTDVVTWLAREAFDRYNPFNLLVMDAESALWIAYDGKPEMFWLEPGLHILANRNLNDGQSLRVQRARDLIEPVQSQPLHELMLHLEGVCRDHQDNVADRETLCMHRDDTQYGTVSSSILAIAPGLQQSRYLYASGHPCTAAYQDYSFLFTQTHCV